MKSVRDKEASIGAGPTTQRLDCVTYGVSIHVLILGTQVAATAYGGAIAISTPSLTVQEAF